MLIMEHGANQEFTPTGVLNFLAFDTYPLDLRPLLPETGVVRYKLSDRYLHELIYPDVGHPWEARQVDPMLAEAHARLASPLYNVAFAFLALTAVLGGAFDRTGYSARIAGVGVAALVTRTLGFAVESACGSLPSLNVLQYAAPALVIAACAWILFRRTSRSRGRTSSLRSTGGRVMAVPS
jgi:lipopolysaccharide export system permease protein